MNENYFVIAMEGRTPVEVLRDLSLSTGLQESERLAAAYETAVLCASSGDVLKYYKNNKLVEGAAKAAMQAAIKQGMKLSASPTFAKLVNKLHHKTDKKKEKLKRGEKGKKKNKK